MTSKQKMTCDICGKNSLKDTGWHLAYDLDFCSNICVARWIEATEKYINKYSKVFKDSEKRKSWRRANKQAF